MKIRMMVGFVVIIFTSIIFSDCTGSNKSSSESNTEQAQNGKPKLCDCQNYWLKDVEDIMIFGKTEPSDFVKECQEYYSVEEITYADCGITEYDPNFKAN